MLAWIIDTSMKMWAQIQSRKGTESRTMTHWWLLILLVALSSEMVLVSQISTNSAVSKSVLVFLFCFLFSFHAFCSGIITLIYPHSCFEIMVNLSSAVFLLLVHFFDFSPWEYLLLLSLSSCVPAWACLLFHNPCRVSAAGIASHLTEQVDTQTFISLRISLSFHELAPIALLLTYFR